MAFDYVGMVEIFENADLMIEKSLCGFAFEGLVFDEFDSNRLLIKLVNSEINVTETSLTDAIRPVEEIMFDFFDNVLIGIILSYHLYGVLFHLVGFFTQCSSKCKILI